MTNDMVSAEQLRPWGAYPEAAVDAVVQQVRAACGWHIAPERTETLTLDAKGADYLMLPTLKVSEVSAVRVWDEGRHAMRELSDAEWSARTGWSANGMLYRPGGWPDGFRTVEVDLVHGYQQAPAELLRLVADGTARRVQAESLQGHAITWAADDTHGMGSALDAYRIPLEA